MIYDTNMLTKIKPCTCWSIQYNVMIYPNTTSMILKSNLNEVSMNNQKGMQIETQYSASVFDFIQVSTCETHRTLQWNSSHALKLRQVFDQNFDNCLNKPKRFGTMIHKCKRCKCQLCGLTGWHPRVAKYQRWLLLQNEPHHCQCKPIVFLDLPPRHPNCKRRRTQSGVSYVSCPLGVFVLSQQGRGYQHHLQNESHS